MSKISEDSYLHKLIFKWIRRLQQEKEENCITESCWQYFVFGPYLPKYVFKYSNSNWTSSGRHFYTIHVKDRNSNSDSKWVKIGYFRKVMPLAATCIHLQPPNLENSISQDLQVGLIWNFPTCYKISRSTTIMKNTLSFEDGIID